MANKDRWLMCGNLKVGRQHPLKCYQFSFGVANRREANRKVANRWPTEGWLIGGKQKGGK